MSVISDRFQLKKEDLKKVLKNALVFAAPAILVLVADIKGALPDWLEGKYLVVILYGLDVLIDAFKKWVSINKYK